MHDTIYILPNHILATMDTLRFVSTKVNDISDRFYQYLGIIIPAVVSILSVLFVARSAKRGIEESSLNTAKQLDNAFSIAQLNVNNSIKLVERQTYVDLILRDKNIWRGELMEISAQIEKETISFLTSEQSIDKQQHKAHISYLIKKMQTRLSTKDKYPTHKELLLTLKQLDNL